MFGYRVWLAEALSDYHWPPLWWDGSLLLALYLKQILRASRAWAHSPRCISFTLRPGRSFGLLAGRALGWIWAGSLGSSWALSLARAGRRWVALGRLSDRPAGGGGEPPHGVGNQLLPSRVVRDNSCALLRARLPTGERHMRWDIGRPALPPCLIAPTNDLCSAGVLFSPSS